MRYCIIQLILLSEFEQLIFQFITLLFLCV